MAARKEAELAGTLALREQEIMAAVNRREQEASKMWAGWAAGVKEEALQVVNERMAWVQERAEEVERERETLESLREELERRVQQLEIAERKVNGGAIKNLKKTPLEEVKNLLAPLVQFTSANRQASEKALRVQWASARIWRRLRRLEMSRTSEDIWYIKY